MSPTMTYDPEADAIYVYLAGEDAKAAETDELDDYRSVDYDEAGVPIGVELLSVSHGINVAGLPRGEEIAGILRRLTGVQVAAA